MSAGTHDLNGKLTYLDTILKADFADGQAVSSIAKADGTRNVSDEAAVVLARQAVGTFTTQEAHKVGLAANTPPQPKSPGSYTLSS